MDTAILNGNLVLLEETGQPLMWITDQETFDLVFGEVKPGEEDYMEMLRRLR